MKIVNPKSTQFKQAIRQTKVQPFIVSDHRKETGDPELTLKFHQITLIDQSDSQ